MVPPRPVALGVCSSTPPIRRTATTTSMTARAWLIWCMKRKKVYRTRSKPRPAWLCYLRQTLVDGIPVNGVPPGGDVVGALVLVLQVVRVLPDVDAEDGHPPLRDRVVLVGEALDRELATGQVGPAPAASELADGRLAGSVLVGGEDDEGVLDGRRDSGAGLYYTVRAQNRPAG